MKKRKRQAHKLNLADKYHQKIDIPANPDATASITVSKDLGHDQLINALFFFWDGFERATMNFFLVKDTAKQAIADQPLAGDRISLGIRRMEWEGGQERIFRAFMEHERVLSEKMENGLIYDFRGVPVYLYVYDENPCITGLDIIFYRNETFNTPTPFKRFCEEFELL